MSESDVEVEFKSDDDDTESVGSVTGSLDDSKNESKSVYFSDDDDLYEEGGDVKETGSNDASVEKGYDDDDEDEGVGNDDQDEDDDDDEYEDDDDDDILQKFDHETKKKIHCGPPP